MPLYQYAFAAGHGVALVSLVNPENLTQFRLRGVALPPTSQPIDFYPVRRVSLSQKVYGDGDVLHRWFWPVLPLTAVQYINSTFFASGINALMTIYTRVHEEGGYARFNVEATQPQPGVDYTYDRGRFRDYTLTFRKLTRL